jgi:hypothetical protein
MKLSKKRTTSSRFNPRQKMGIKMTIQAVLILCSIVFAVWFYSEWKYAANPLTLIFEPVERIKTIAAKLVYPDRHVVAVTGDGGFMMNCQELETALRAKTNFVTLIFNDNGYGLIGWKQMNQFGHTSYVDFTNPDFVKFAESMGLKGYHVESAADLIPTLKTALAQDVPTVIDCPVDYSENIRFSKKAGDLNCKI